MLHRENARESTLAPTVDHPIQHARLVWRIGERDVVAVLAERRRKRQRVTLEYSCAIAESQCNDVRLERVQARRPELDEVGAVRSPRDGFETQSARSGEQVQNPRVFYIGVEQIEQCGAYVFGGGPNAGIGGRHQITPRELPANDSHYVGSVACGRSEYFPITAKSSSPWPCAVSSSMRSAMRGSAASGSGPAVSIIRRTSLRAIVSSNAGSKLPAIMCLPRPEITAAGLKNSTIRSASVDATREPDATANTSAT